MATLRRKRQKIPITTASGTEIAPLVTLHKVKVAGNLARKVKAICHDLPPQSPVDGLLGLSFLKRFESICISEGERLSSKGPLRK